MNQVIMRDDPQAIAFFQDMKHLSALLDMLETNTRPILNGESFLTDTELAQHLKLTKRTTEQFLMDLVQPYFQSLYVTVQFQRHTVLPFAASLQVIPQIDWDRALDAYLILLSVDGYPEEHRSLAVFLQPALADEEQNLH